MHLFGNLRVEDKCKVNARVFILWVHHLIGFIFCFATLQVID